MKKFLLAVKFLERIHSGVARLETILILVLWMAFEMGGLLIDSMVVGRGKRETSVINIPVVSSTCLAPAQVPQPCE